MMHKNKGTITVYLSIILMVMIIFVGVLIDGARMRAGRAHVERAVKLSTKSVLAGYHSKLKQEYGIFALNENSPDELEGVLTDYLYKNLLIENNANTDFFNVYDFRVDSVRVTPIFNLTDTRVTRNQIVQYMKYRAPKELIQGFTDKIATIKNFSGRSKIMKDKVEVDKDLSDIREYQESLAEKIKFINKFDEDYLLEQIDNYKINVKEKEEYEEELDNLIDQKANIKKEDNEEPDDEEESLNKEIREKREKLKEINKEIKHIKSEIDNYLKNYILKNLSASTCAQTIISESQSLNNKITTINKKLSDKKDNFSKKVKSDISKYKNKISKKKLENLKNEFENNWCVLKDIQNGIDNLDKCENIKNNINAYNCNISYYLSHKRSDSSKKKYGNITDIAKKAVKERNEEKSNNDKDVISNDIFDNLPSQCNYEKVCDFSGNDVLDNVEFNKKRGKGKFVSNALDYIGESLDKSTQNLNSMRNELYVNEYIIGNFKNAVSDKLQDKSTFFSKGEAEYILIGNKNQSFNINAVKSEILLVRFGLNTIHIYMDATKNNLAFNAAVSTAWWTGFGVPIVHTVIMCGWSMAESILDVKDLMKGKEVPLYKTKKDWKLDIGNLKKVIVENTLGEVKDKTVENMDRVESFIEESVENFVQKTVDEAFAPIYDAVDKADELYENEFNNLYDESSYNEGEFGQIKKSVINMVSNEMCSIKDDVKNKTIEEINMVKFEIVEKVNNKVETELGELMDKLKNTVLDKLKMEEHELTKDAADNFGTEASEDLKSNFFTLSYEDYLRIFLLMENSDTKIKRIQDIIQLNLDGFDVCDYNTYIKVEAEISMKYLFMTQPFMPQSIKTEEGDRHKFKVVLYEGY